MEIRHLSKSLTHTSSKIEYRFFFVVGTTDQGRDDVYLGNFNKTELGQDYNPLSNTSFFYDFLAEPLQSFY